MLHFDIPIFGTMTWTICLRQTQLPRIVAALTSPESCRKCLLSFFLEHQQFIPGDVFLNICKLLIFPAYASSTQRNYFHSFLLFHVPYPRYRRSVQIITFVVICYNSHITLHYNTGFKESKNFLYIKHSGWCNNHNIYQYFQSQPTRTLRTILSRCNSLDPESGSRSKNMNVYRN